MSQSDQACIMLSRVPLVFCPSLADLEWWVSVVQQPPPEPRAKAGVGDFVASLKVFSVAGCAAVSPHPPPPPRHTAHSQYPVWVCVCECVYNNILYLWINKHMVSAILAGRQLSESGLRVMADIKERYSRRETPLLLHVPSNHSLSPQGVHVYRTTAPYMLG